MANPKEAPIRTNPARELATRLIAVGSFAISSLFASDTKVSSSSLTDEALQDLNTRPRVSLKVDDQPYGDIFSLVGSSKSEQSKEQQFLGAFGEILSVKEFSLIEKESIKSFLEERFTWEKLQEGQYILPLQAFEGGEKIQFTKNSPFDLHARGIYQLAEDIKNRYKGEVEPRLIVELKDGEAKRASIVLQPNNSFSIGKSKFTPSTQSWITVGNDGEISWFSTDGLPNGSYLDVITNIHDMRALQESAKRRGYELSPPKGEPFIVVGRSKEGEVIKIFSSQNNSLILDAKSGEGVKVKQERIKHPEYLYEDIIVERPRQMSRADLNRINQIIRQAEFNGVFTNGIEFVIKDSKGKNITWNIVTNVPGLRIDAEKTNFPLLLDIIEILEQRNPDKRGISRVVCGVLFTEKFIFSERGDRVSQVINDDTKLNMTRFQGNTQIDIAEINPQYIQSLRRYNIPEELSVWPVAYFQLFNGGLIGPGRYINLDGPLFLILQQRYSHGGNFWESIQFQAMQRALGVVVNK